MSRQTNERSRLVFLLILWSGLIGIGMFWGLQYEFTPGPVGAISEKWPEGSSIARDPKRYQLLLFAHPKCSCTRATLRELERLLAFVPPRVLNTQVLFLHDPSQPSEWTETDTWFLAKSIEEAEVRVDLDGKEASRFGATTSGQALLFDSAGSLVFCGGLTASRAHEGDSIGKQTILEILNGRRSPIKETPFFGCKLFTTKKE